jgi:SecD/SecF fusion protein
MTKERIEADIMRPFFWKIVICLAPCLLAAWVTTTAILKYINGDSGGFKMGVDLVGGTILVYEIDTRKQLDQGQKFDANQDTNLLATSLKRRIDPNDLYNITIRPAGGEGRVEIILPTGGVYRTKKAEEAWTDLLEAMKKKYGLSELEVGRGKILELADRIQLTLAEEKWATKLLNDPADPTVWKRFLDDFWAQASDNFPDLYDAKTNEEKPEPKKRINAVPAGQLKEFIRVVQTELGSSSSEKVIETWIKGEAWSVLLERVKKQWPELKDLLLTKDVPPAKRLFGAIHILPDNTEQLIGFIHTRGNIVSQAAISDLAPVLGEDILPGGKKGFPDINEVTKFIEANYGPSLQSITRSIQEEKARAAGETVERYRQSSRSKDLTLEEVQRIKDLVAKVGSLEFRILANSVDDAAAEKDAADLINNKAFLDPKITKEVEEAQEMGKPPPGPRVPGSSDPKVYDIQLPRNQKSTVTYSWVELGPQERRQLNLDNAAEHDPLRNKTWLAAAKERKDKKGKGGATTLPDLSDPQGHRQLLQGALFYSRPCVDRNLPEEERRQKAIEYFVLTRDPEIDPKLPQNWPLDKRRTPKIDGSYLRSAMSGIADVRPAVHFTFNEAGGEFFGTLTRKNIPSGSGPEESQTKRHLAIVLDGLIMSAPTINSEIRTQGQITGSFTRKEVDNLVNILRAGALPASLKPQPVSESTMGATLGQDTIQAGVTAVLLAFMVILLFMIVYYRFAGMVASVALLANLLLTIGFMVAVQATFTLPGLAGLVLMLGMAVDANVLIYERLREERERGANLALAIRNGYDRAFPTIIDTHLSSIFTAIVLYIVGNDQLKGFGVSLTAGLIISLFTSLYMTRMIFDIWLAKGWLHKLSMFRFFTRPDIDFMGVRYIFFTLTLVLSLLGIGVFIGRLPLNIDFTGGTAYGARLERAANIQEVRKLLSEDKQKEWLHPAEVKEEEGSNGRHFVVRYENPDKSLSAPRTISLANPIAPPDEVDKNGSVTQSHKPEREKNFAERASRLPDISVEQLFPTFDKKTKGDQSCIFTFRTSEKEAELVQASVDRLLRDDTGKPLLEKIHLWYDPTNSAAAGGIRLRFYTQKPPTNFDPIANLKKDEKDQLPAEFASPSFVKTLLTRELMKAFGKKDKDELPVQFDLLGEGKTHEGRYQVMYVKFSDQLRPDQLAKVGTALAATQREFEDRPQPERLENFDSQLASETRYRAMWAILASWGAIAMYLWFRFGNWTFGLAAVICLIHDLFFTMGVVAAAYYIHTTFIGQWLLLEDFKIDLPAVAALLTLVGYSVNDTIVVFDRIREVRGKNPDLTPQMINDSVNQTLSRTLLTSLATWLVVIVLYIWGGPGVHLFAFVMVVGVIVGTYSSIYIASPLLLMLGEGHKEAPLRGGQRPLQPRSVGAAV